MSSRRSLGKEGEGVGFVEELTGLQAVLQLTEKHGEQVALGLRVPVTRSAAGVEMAAVQQEHEPKPSTRVGIPSLPND